MSRSLALLLLAAPLPLCLAAGPGADRSPRAALQPFNVLIGSWKGTGIPQGSPAGARQDFWIETMDWSWRFKGDDAWLSVTFDNGRHFRTGELRYVPARDAFALSLQTPDKHTVTFAGKLTDHTLTLERTDPAGERQQLVFRLLHENRFLYQYQVRPGSGGLFRRVYQVGATKQGVPFAQGDGRPVCVVSGGQGTTAVTYQGKTYYVCCSGCKAEFEADPEKYVKEFEQKQGK